MWIQKYKDKYRYFERYVDPLTETTKTVSVILAKKTPQAKKEATRLLNDKIEKQLDETSKQKVTYKQLHHEFWVYYPHTVKDSTASRHQSNDKILKRHIPDKALLDKIDRLFLQKLLDSLYYEENYSFATVRQIKSLLKSMFQLAVKKGYLTDNPVSAVEIKRKKMSEEVVTENNFLEKEELTCLLETQEKHSRNKRYARITEFMALTGLRFGEMAALKEENYHQDYVEVTGTIDFSKNVSQTIKTYPKTKKALRKIILNQRSRELIEEAIHLNHLMKESFKDYQGYIFCTSEGFPFSNVNFNRNLQKSAKIAGINKKVSSHTLRHSHISYLIEMGIDLKTIMDRVGHTKPEITLSIYSHVTNKMNLNLADKLDGLNF